MLLLDQARHLLPADRRRHLLDRHVGQAGGQAATIGDRVYDPCFRSGSEAQPSVPSILPVLLLRPFAIPLRSCGHSVIIEFSGCSSCNGTIQAITISRRRRPSRRPSRVGELALLAPSMLPTPHGRVWDVWAHSKNSLAQLGKRTFLPLRQIQTTKLARPKKVASSFQNLAMSRHTGSPTASDTGSQRTRDKDVEEPAAHKLQKEILPRPCFSPPVRGGVPPMRNTPLDQTAQQSSMTDLSGSLRVSQHRKAPNQTQ